MSGLNRASPSSTRAYRALHLALHLALLDRLALVADVLAARQRDLDLRARALEVEPRRHQRQPLLARLADQPLDLALVHQQLARALGLVVLARGRRVGRYVDVVQPDLAVLELRVAVLELRLAAAQRLDLGAGQHEAGLPLLEQVIAVGRLLVGRDVGHDYNSTGERSARPRGASTRSTCTVTGSPSRIALPDPAPISITSSGSRSHQSPRSRRTGKSPSCPSPNATKAPAPITPITSPGHSVLQPCWNSSASSRNERAMSSALRSIAAASRSRSEHHSPASSIDAAGGGSSPAPIAASSARWQIRSG